MYNTKGRFCVLQKRVVTLGTTKEVSHLLRGYDYISVLARQVDRDGMYVRIAGRRLRRLSASALKDSE